MAAQRQERITILMPKEEAMRLRQHAKFRGYLIHSGKNVGEGSVTALLRALARGEITMAPDGIGGGENVNLDDAMIRLEGVKRIQEHLAAEYRELKAEMKALAEAVEHTIGEKIK